MLFKIGIGFIVAFLLFMLTLGVVLLIKRSVIEDLVEKEKGRRPHLTGSWHGGTFFVQPWFPIEIKTNNTILLKEIERHNKLIKYFWLNCLTLIMGIILCNLSY